MVRTQLYLPEETYKVLKKKAKAKGMTFAAFVRVFLESEVLDEKDKKKTLYEAFPFMKLAGTFDWGGDASNNEEIDKAIYDF